MCGIAGIGVSTAADGAALQAALTRMVRALRHRGPDDEGWEAIPNGTEGEPALLLANTRLAILDRSAAGHQPMRDPSTGNWIVLNGEIYNYRALRDELAGDADWRSHTDTEVVLRAYGKWGVDCLERLRGMYAVALWDQAARRLLLARDPFGIKPLYYVASRNQFLFASEVRALLASGLVPRRLNREGLASYLSFGSVETPLTIIHDVLSLPPAHLLIIEMRNGAVATMARQYTQLPGEQPTTSPGSRSAAARAVYEVVSDSVRAHLVSDVPVGAFLSGGIDSSAVVALMHRVSNAPPRTFSVVFAERQFSEAPYARAIAERYSTVHTEIPLSESDLLAMLPDALRAMDQPTMDGINTYVVSRAVHQAGITVALSGLGGDELFGGYPSFARVRRARLLTMLPEPIRRTLAGIVSRATSSVPRAAKAGNLLDAISPLDVYRLSRQLFGQSDIQAFGLACGADVSSRLPAVPADADPFLAISLYELGHYMANTLLRDTDCMSMAHALEVRVPFVDRDVVRTVLAIPSLYKMNGQRPKGLLLDALGDMLPTEVWQRPKQGFALPFDCWMRSALRAEV